MKYLFGLFYGLFTPMALITWVAIIRSYLSYRGRINRERTLFHSAIDSDYYEGRHFIQMSLTIGLLASVVSLISGAVLPLSWAVIYPLIGVAVVLLVPRVMTIVPLLLTTIVAAGWQSTIDARLPKWLLQLGYQVNAPNMLGVLALTTIATGGLAYFLSRNAGSHLSPKIEYNKRKTMVAVYPFNELTIAPVAVLVPGNWFSSHLPWWPVLNVGGHSVAFLVLPLLIGAGITVKHMLPATFFANLAKRLWWLTGLGVVMVIGLRFFTDWALIGAVGYGVIALLVVTGSLIADRRQSFSNSQVMNGIRVIGIQPHSPAAKMNLVVGDVILEVNGQAVSNEDDFYRALITNATYCRLKVRDRNDQLKMTETAIFQGAAHEIGIKTFPANAK